MTVAGPDMVFVNRARAVAEAFMTDSCVIVRPAATEAATGLVDPVTGLRASQAATLAVVYSGACAMEEKRIQNPGAGSTAGDAPITEFVTVKIPALAPAAKVGDILTVTAAPDHPRDVGRRFRVSSINPATLKKSQDFQATAVVG